MKSRCRTTARFIFVIYFAIFSSGCMTVESYRTYDPELDSTAIANATTLVLKDGRIIILEESSSARIVLNAQSQRALRFVYSDTFWDETRLSYNVSGKTDTISLDKIQEIRVEELNGGATFAVIFGSAIGISLIVLAILAVSRNSTHSWIFDN